MHAVARTYAGTDAGALFDLIEERKAEVEDLLRSVTGFVSYAAFRTDDGGVTVTVCQDKTGTEESTEVARNWVAENAADLSVKPPGVSEGPVFLHLA